MKHLHEDQSYNYNKLFEDIKGKIGRPVNINVVQATIESFGIRDIDTKEDYGATSIEDLAEDIFIQLNIVVNKEEEPTQTPPEQKFPVSGYQWVETKLFLKHYPLGLFHLVPIFIQILCIIIFRYSLWTYLGFNEIQSTAVVLGVILGLVLTGGFVQVIGRQASFYWYNNDYALLKTVSLHIIKYGLKSIALFFVGLFAINFFIHLYPNLFIGIVFMYTLLIGMLLLLVAPMHALKKRWMVSLVIALGTVAAILLKTYTDIHVYFTHWLGIGLAIIFTMIYFKIYFKNLITESNNEIMSRTPRVTALIYKNYPYFIYGMLLYSFVFMDRILAWSSNYNGTLPFVLYYEKDYEIGMDIAILAFFLLAGVLEYSIVSFSKFLDTGQKETAFKNANSYNKKIIRMYKNHLLLLVASSSIIAIFIYGIIAKDWGYQTHFRDPLTEVSKTVCIIGAIAYTFFSVAMLNTLYQFTLNQSTKPLKALVIATITNLIIGMILSRNFSYEYSVIGMLVGSIVFMLLTMRENIRFFKNIDYYYYASY